MLLFNFCISQDRLGYTMLGVMPTPKSQWLKTMKVYFYLILHVH